MTELPTGWAWAALGDVLVSLRNGGFVSRPAIQPPGIRILRISSVRPNHVDLDDVRYAPMESDGGGHYIANGDLLFTRYSGNPKYVGTCGVVRGLREPTLHPDKLIRADVDGRIADPVFIAFAVNTGASRRAIEERMKTTAGQVGIAGSSLRTVPIPLPPLMEQHRIVAAIEEQLSRIDAGEVALREAARGTSALAEAAVRAAEHGESSPLGDLLVEPLANGRSVPTANSGFPVLRLTALREGRIDLHKRKTGAWEKEDAERFLVKRGDFFISRGNGSIALVGRGGLVELQPDDVAFPDTMIRARVDSSRIDPRFLRVVWNGPRTRRQIERAARTTAGIYKVNQKDLERVTLPVPPIEVQNEIVAANEYHTTVVDALRTAISHALVRSRHLRRAVVERALSGRLVPQVRNDEPASELLDRIAAERVDTPKSRPRKRS